MHGSPFEMPLNNEEETMERRTFLTGTVVAAAGSLMASPSSVEAQNAATPVAPKAAFHVDLKKTPESAEIKTHNRWHPDIPMISLAVRNRLFRELLRRTRAGSRRQQIRVESVRSCSSSAQQSRKWRD